MTLNETEAIGWETSLGLPPWISLFRLLDLMNLKLRVRFFFFFFFFWVSFWNYPLMSTFCVISLDSPPLPIPGQPTKKILESPATQIQENHVHAIGRCSQRNDGQYYNIFDEKCRSKKRENFLRADCHSPLQFVHMMLPLVTSFAWH